MTARPHDWHRMEGWLAACRVCGLRDTGDQPEECPGQVDRAMPWKPREDKPND